MKSYLVAEFDLPLAPLDRSGHQGPLPLKGVNLRNCDSLAEARSYALQASPSRDRASIYLRRTNGRLERIEHYQKPFDGLNFIQRYVRNIRDRHFMPPVTC